MFQQDTHNGFPQTKFEIGDVVHVRFTTGHRIKAKVSNIMIDTKNDALYMLEGVPTLYFNSAQLARPNELNPLHLSDFPLAPGC